MVKREANGTVFVSWMDFHGRSEGIAKLLGAESLYFGGAQPALIRYVLHSVTTFVALVRKRPRVVFVMQPPVLALFPVLLYARLFRARMAADLHTGVFYDPKWRWAMRLTLRVLRPDDVVIVTNEHLAQICERANVRTLVLHDMIENAEDGHWEPVPPRSAASLMPYEYVLAPVCYEYDEPIDEILAAAEQLPVQFVLTGRPPADLPRRAPGNVLFTGYVSNEVYWSLLAGATCVLALTTEEHTMQRAGYESLCFGKAAVVSSTEVLRSYFGDSVCYALPSSDSIASATKRAIAERSSLERRMRELRTQYMLHQESTVDALKDWLRTPDARPNEPGRGAGRGWEPFHREARRRTSRRGADSAEIAVEIKP